MELVSPKLHLVCNIPKTGGEPQGLERVNILCDIWFANEFNFSVLLILLKHCISIDSYSFS